MSKPTSRRAILAGIAASSVAALPVAAVATTGQSDDSELLRLEAQLAALGIEYDKLDEESVKPEFREEAMAAMDRISELDNKVQDAIRDTPAHSGVGIAVKLRLVLRLGGNLEENFDHQDLITLSAMRDAERLAGKGAQG